MSDTADFTYSIKKANGYQSKMFGKLHSPDQHGVVTAALEGELSDDCGLLIAAPELLEALKGLLADIEEYQQINKLGGENNHWQVISRAAIAKALGEQK